MIEVSRCMNGGLIAMDLVHVCDQSFKVDDWLVILMDPCDGTPSGALCCALWFGWNCVTLVLGAVLLLFCMWSA